MKNFYNLAFDIETIPNENFRAEIEKVYPEEPHYVPHKGLKDPEKIKTHRDKWAIDSEKKHREACLKIDIDHNVNIAKQDKAMSLNPLENVIICIGWKTEDSFGASMNIDIDNPEKGEKAVLKSFFKIIQEYQSKLTAYIKDKKQIETMRHEANTRDKYYTMLLQKLKFHQKDIYHPIRYITFNGKSFDVPVLRLHAMKHGLRMPKISVNRYDNSEHLDVFLKLNEGRRQPSGSMDAVASFLGIEGKGDVDGSMILDMWNSGRHDEIREYCILDCEITYEIAKRLEGQS